MEKEELDYVCGFCGHNFKQKVGMSGGEKHSKVSSQVKCPHCKNFIPTWT